jgi:hypothetical protein
LQQLEGQRALPQHLVVKRPNIESRAELLLRTVSQLANT